jgi:hypothetical protein
MFNYSSIQTEDAGSRTRRSSNVRSASLCKPLTCCTHDVLSSLRIADGRIIMFSNPVRNHPPLPVHLQSRAAAKVQRLKHPRLLANHLAKPRRLRQNISPRPLLHAIRKTPNKRGLLILSPRLHNPNLHLLCHQRRFERMIILSAVCSDRHSKTL